MAGTKTLLLSFRTPATWAESDSIPAAQIMRKEYDLFNWKHKQYHAVYYAIDAIFPPVKS